MVGNAFVQCTVLQGITPGTYLLTLTSYRYIIDGITHLVTFELITNIIFDTNARKYSL